MTVRVARYALIALVAGSGCDRAASPVPLPGSYALRRIGNDSLPWRSYEDDAGYTVVVQGSLTLGADGGFREIVHLRLGQTPDSVATAFSADTVIGTYTVRPGEIELATDGCERRCIFAGSFDGRVVLIRWPEGPEWAYEAASAQRFVW